MATMQSSLLAPSSLVSLGASPISASSRSTVDCKAWTMRRSSAQQQRWSLTVQASSSAGRPAPPSSPSGLGGTEVPLGANVTSAPVPQKGVPKEQRIAYVCSACGYIYDLDMPFEEQPDSYACPVCTAPKEDFTASNATLGEGVYDPTKKEDASASSSN